MRRVLAGILAVVSLALCVAQPVMADGEDICNDSSISGELKAIAGCKATEDDRADKLVNEIIQIVIGVIGLLAVFVMIYGGFVFLTSTGDTSKVTKGKNVMIYGVVGLVVAIMAFAIVRFIGAVIQR